VVDGVKDRAITDHHARGGRVAGARTIDNDLRDRSIGIHHGVALGLDAIRCIRQIKVDRRESISKPTVGELDIGFNAAVGGRRRAPAGTTPAEDHRGRRVAGAGAVHPDCNDGSLLDDGHIGRCTRPGPGDVGLRIRVAAPRIGHGDAGDGAVGADRGDSSRSSTITGNGYRGIRQREGTVGPVRVRPEVVGNLRLIGGVCGHGQSRGRPEHRCASTQHERSEHQDHKQPIEQLVSRHRTSPFPDRIDDRRALQRFVSLMVGLGHVHLPVTCRWGSSGMNRPPSTSYAAVSGGWSVTACPRA
jgi:hypothetical protein